MDHRLGIILASVLIRKTFDYPYVLSNDEMDKKYRKQNLEAFALAAFSSIAKSITESEISVKGIKRRIIIENANVLTGSDKN